MANYVKIRCAPLTIRNYEIFVRAHISPALGSYRLTSIRHETVQRFIIDLYHRQYAGNTMVNLLGVISCSMRYAKRQGQYVRELYASRWAKLRGTPYAPGS